MKKLITLICFIAFSWSLQAQMLDITPSIGTLDDAIKADTNANGTRKDTNRVYWLARNGVYVLRGMVAHTGYDLRIESAAHAPLFCTKVVRWLSINCLKQKAISASKVCI